MSRIDAPESHSFQLKWPRFPFPGLRPFRETPEADESLIFYGRNKQKDDILRRLDTAQFVSVVGPSGCGKSSLVKVGVIHALTAGLLTKAGWNWRIVEMRPGTDPLGNLAAALATLGGRFDPDFGTAEAQIREVLSVERSALWVLMDHMASTLVNDTNESRPSRVLLLIDQFEEVFSSGQDQRSADQFIGLVSEFFRKPHSQLYVVLTMRTDFIGQCANFPGLAEILNDTQYITPVLRGQDLSDAITCPAEAYQGAIEPALVTALVRDMGSGAGYDADHLPLMQHALLWLWQRACAKAGITEPSGPDANWPADRPRVYVTLDDYRRHGGLAGILNRHADDILGRIESGPEGAAEGRIVELMFRRMSERDASARYKRSPVLASEVCALAQCTPRALATAVEPFCGIGASFVERRATHRPDDPLLDLSHESLIRQWRWLRAKADDEAGKVYMFRRFTSDAQVWDQHARSRAYLKRGGQLWLLRDWWTRHQPTESWARRYAIAEGSPGKLSDCFPVVEAYRLASLRAEQRARLIRWITPPLGALALAGAAFLVLSLRNADLVRAKNEDIERAALVMGQDELEHGHATRALAIAVALLQNKTEFPHVPKAERLAYEALEQLRQVAVQEVQMPRSQRWTIDVSPGGRHIVSASDNRITITDTASHMLWPVRLPFSDDLSLPDTQWAVRLSPDGGRALLSAKERAFVTPLNLPVHPPAIASADMHPLLDDGTKGGIGFGFFSADGGRVATFAWRDNRTVSIWDAASGEHIGKNLRLAVAATFGVMPALNAGATLLAEPTTQGVVVYDTATNARRERPIAGAPDAESTAPGIRPPPVAFHPFKPDVLALVSGAAVELWDLSSNAASWRVGEAVDPSDISQIAFSQNGELLAVWGTYGARILAADTGETVAFLGEHESGVLTLRFDPDGQHVATVGRDRDSTLRTWTLEAALPVQKAKADSTPTASLPFGTEPQRARNRGEAVRVSFSLAAGALRIDAVEPQGAPRNRRDSVPGVSDPAGDTGTLLVYRNTDAAEPVAALHGLSRKTVWQSLRLDGGDKLVGLTNDGYQYTWTYFADRDSLLKFAEARLLQEPAAYVGLTRSEGCLLEPVGGRC